MVAQGAVGARSMNKIGSVRKLKTEEHILTRTLWEQIFTEDSKEFLDYYYSVKTKDNEIYVIEDGQEIVAMLHLNPYKMRIGKEIYDTHYIVAVATDEKYRRQGLMARLMKHVLQVMADRGEPFTFLMPANEAYYEPFGFQTVLKKKDLQICGADIADSRWEFKVATEADCKNMAHFANAYLKDYDVTTHRTENYYRTLLAEHACEGGGILLIKGEGEIRGLIPHFGKPAVEIKGIMVPNESCLKQAIYYLTGSSEKAVICKEFPFMVKALSAEWKNLFKSAKVFLDEVV